MLDIISLITAGLIVLLLLGGAVIVVINRLRNKNPPKPQPIDCSKTPENPLCRDKRIDCGLLDPTTIKPCDPANSICGTCKCSASNPDSTGCMQCRSTDPETNPYHLDIDEADCRRGQYTEWDEMNKYCVLKKGNYCLPTQIVDISCNKFTGRKVLANDSLTEPQYYWKCICRDNTKFTNNGNTQQDCTSIKVCGMEGSEENPSPDLGRGLVKYTDETKTDYDYWNANSDWDPLVNTSCRCRPGEINNDNYLTCLPDSCSPGELDPTDQTGLSCNCGSGNGLIDCLKISYVVDQFGTPYYSGVCPIPSCVPDPCRVSYIDDNGEYKIAGNFDENEGKCVCPPGWTSIPSFESITGFRCVKFCDRNEGTDPCGDRGTCYVYNGDNPYGSSDWEYTQDINSKVLFKMTYQRIDTNTTETKYLTIIDNKLTLDNAGTLFYTWTGGDSISSDSKSVPLIIKLNPNDMKTATPIMLSTDKTVNPGDMHPSMVNSVNFMNYNLDSGNYRDNSHTVKIYLYRTGDKIGKCTLLDSQNRLLGIDKKSGSLVSLTRFNGTARCKDCRVPYYQDGQKLCNNTCKPNGFDCRHDCEAFPNPCCSGNCNHSFGYEIGTCGGDGGNYGDISNYYRKYDGNGNLIEEGDRIVNSFGEQCPNY